MHSDSLRLTQAHSSSYSVTVTQKRDLRRRHTDEIQEFHNKNILFLLFLSFSNLHLMSSFFGHSVVLELETLENKDL